MSASYWINGRDGMPAGMGWQFIFKGPDGQVPEATREFLLYKPCPLRCVQSQATFF